MNAPLHLGVDAVNLLHDRRGIYRYTRALLRRWMLDPSVAMRITLLLPYRWPGLYRRKLIAALDCDKFDVRRRQDVTATDPALVWYPWNGMAWVSPSLNVATIHDVWPFASPADSVAKRKSEQMPFRNTAAYARVIITDSGFSKNEILKYLAVEPARLHVINLGVDPPSSTQVQPLVLSGASRYVLFVGESEPRKDLATLRSAMEKLSDALRMTTGLVIAGKPSKGERLVGRVQPQRHDGKQTSALHFEVLDGVPTLITGEITDALLSQLYAGAAAFVFPSRYEGFGLPVLEAMAQGTPVIASKAASVPEVAGDAAIYFAAGNAAALANEITRLLNDRVLVAQLGAAGIARAAALSWERCAQQTLALFESVYASACNVSRLTIS